MQLRHLFFCSHWLSLILFADSGHFSLSLSHNSFQAWIVSYQMSSSIHNSLNLPIASPGFFPG
jgi:hypothetical protein